jgi:hypothetical protein
MPVFEVGVGHPGRFVMEDVPTRDSYRGGGGLGGSRVCLMLYVNIEGNEAIGRRSCESEDQVKDPHVGAFFVRFRCIHLVVTCQGWCVF